METGRNGEGTREISGGTYKLNLPGPDMKSSRGDDTLYGSSGNDRMSGGLGDDVVFGFDGNDLIDFSQGKERIFGGGGNDRFVTENLGNFNGAGELLPVIDGGDGTDLLDLRGLVYGADLGQSWLGINGSYGNGKLRNIEQVVMTDYDDKAYVGNNDFGLALDKVWLMGGDDTARAGLGTYRIDGGKGFDVIDFYQTRDDLEITKVGRKKYVVTYEDPSFPQNDIKAILTKFELIRFGDGTEMKLGATKWMKAPNAVDFGGLPGKDGNGGNNKLIGTAKDERFDAGGGKDLVRAKDGDDQVLGGAGNDKLFGDGGNDLILGGAGNDKIYGGDGDDTLDGGAGRDVIRGDAGSDLLIGGAGNDKLFAGNGGSAGSTMIGGAGNDIMKGGEGRDSFQFAPGMGQDKILDFEAVATRENGYIRDMLQFEYRAFGEDILDGRSFVEEYATVKGGNIVFNLPGKDSLTLVGITDLDAVAETVWFI